MYARHDNKLILIVTIILVLYLISILAKFTWQLMPMNTYDSQLPTNVTNNITGSNDGGNSIETNLDTLLKLNLFGTIEEEPAVVEEVDITEAPETRLNMVLSGVVASSQENRGAAVIAFRNKQATYSVGDLIEGTQVTLEQIYNDRVIIKNRAARETLMLEGVDFEEANRARVLEQQQPARPNVNRITQQQADDVKRQVLNQPESFTDFIRMAPESGETGLIGYKLTAGNKFPELFTSLGLQNGDIATMLNGLDLTNPQQALEAVSMLQKEEELIIEVIRNDELITVLIEIPQD